MKYESEILYDLMKRDGLLNPSQDNLPYESELKEKYVNDVEGSYPKLIDYRPEWLNYNLNAYIPADFPLETLSNVTNATINNVVPYAYKSAILTGQTLVNVLKKDFDFYSATNVANGDAVRYAYSEVAKANTLYTFIFYVIENSLTWETDGSFRWGNTLYDGQGLFANAKTIKFSQIPNTGGMFVLTNTSRSDYSLSTHGTQVSRTYIDSNTGGTLSLKVLMLEGDYTTNYQHIPYFTGMQSVKMPVLTTTGKNLFDKSKVKYNTTLNSNNGKEETNNLYMSSDFINVEPNENYISNNMGVIFYYDKNRNFIDTLNDSILPQKFTTPNNCKYIRVRCWKKGDIENQKEIVELEQLEKGSTTTSYEPYKSNILTVNEDVTLRGVGEAKDTLDCLTGEVTEYIGEIVLDGSENWYSDGVYFYHNSLKPKNKNVICDKIVVDKIKNPNPATTVVTFSGGGNLEIFVQGVSTKDEFLNWLSVNKPRFTYELATESIKTVDLTVTNQDGNTTSIIRPIEGTMHLSTSGETIKPLFSGEIPVEATTQNLASFVHLEGVE